MNSEDNIFLTANQAAELLNVSLSTLKKFIYQGKIMTVKTPGGHHRILKSDLMALNTSVPILSSEKGSISDIGISQLSKGFVGAIEKRQDFCKGHANSVSLISLKIAKELNLSHYHLNRLYFAALFHDIGMLDISENILNKREILSESEYSIIKTHPQKGEEIAGSIREFKELAVIVRQHHERFDGAGYPDGLKRDKIFLEARIITLGEAFSSMTAKDSYKEPLSKKEALAEIEEKSGSQFDPEIVEVFLKIIGRHKSASLDYTD